MKNSTRSLPTHRLFPLLLLLALTLLLLGACSSTPKTIPEDMEPIEYFQEAQQLAMEEGEYQEAIRYYRTFIERHPDDIQHVVEAQYEIAFLYYKQSNYAAAKDEFNKLLSYYEGGGQNILPEWPQILGTKILNKIESSQESGETEASESASTGDTTGE